MLKFFKGGHNWQLSKQTSVQTPLADCYLLSVISLYILYLWLVCSLYIQLVYVTIVPHVPILVWENKLNWTEQAYLLSQIQEWQMYLGTLIQPQMLGQKISTGWHNIWFITFHYNWPHQGFVCTDHNRMLFDFRGFKSKSRI